MAAKVTLLAGEQIEGESPRAIQACNDYLRMGAGRSLLKLIQKYTKTHQSTPATDSLDTLKKWSTDFDWQSRANEYDAGIEQQKNEKRKKEIESGLALDYERVHKLKRLAAFLEKQIYEAAEPATTIKIGDKEIGVAPVSPWPNVWVRDVKAVDKEKVEIVRFNAAILEQYRGVLDDLAKEVGGRKVEVKHGGDKDNPIVISVNHIDYRDGLTTTEG